MQTTEDTDLERVERFQRGDKTAFQELDKRYRPLLARWAFHSLGNIEDTEDAVQEILIAAYQSLSRFRGDSTFRTWLYRIAVQTLRRLEKARRRRPATENLDERLEIPDEEALSPEAELTRRELIRAVHRALRGVPLKFREPLWLYYQEGLRYEEIAAVLSVPLGTVSDRIKRGKALLRERLQALCPELIEEYL